MLDQLLTLVVYLFILNLVWHILYKNHEGVVEIQF